MIAVSLNVSGGVRLIKPAKLYMCTQNTTNTTRTDARLRVCAAMVPYRWATRGTSLRELDYTPKHMYPVWQTVRYRTKRAINERMNGHRSDLTKRRFQRSPVAENFHLKNHDFNSHVSLSSIEHGAKWSDVTRKARGSYRIWTTRTKMVVSVRVGDWHLDAFVSSLKDG